jgi:hypothetical protein
MMRLLLAAGIVLVASAARGPAHADDRCGCQDIKDDVRKRAACIISCQAPPTQPAQPLPTFPRPHEAPTLIAPPDRAGRALGF